MTDYHDFLARKGLTVQSCGIENPPAAPNHLFPFQSHCVGFLLRQGRGGLYLNTGLGKTRCQLAWAAEALRHAGGKALILTPLAVARQIEREGQSLGYDCRVIRDQTQARAGINICNYDRLHLIDPAAFGAVSLDEASILKSFTGKVSRGLTEAFSLARFRISATATPAPNDHMELGTQAQFLGLMNSNEMLSRWFLNDTGEASQQWRLKGHAVKDFFDWMASWARMAERPADLGDDATDARFELPPLNIVRHRTQRSNIKAKDDDLFGAALVSATNMHDLKRQTAEARADMVASLLTPDPWVIWCDTDYEADALMAAIQGAREVRGSHPVERKEETLDAFAAGEIKWLITKPALTGMGLNWQFCARNAYVGRSFSYESWYQSIRRTWRFGQTAPVEAHIVVAEGEDHIGRVIDRKAGDHAGMKSAMVDAMRRAQCRAHKTKIDYNPTYMGSVPAWLKSAV